MRDDRLRLIFTCCHPALAPAAQVALTLRLLGGLSTAEIARAFLVAGADDGPAPGAGQGQDPRRRHPLPGARARPTCPTGSPGRAGRRLPDLQRGLHGQRGRASSCARTSCAEAIRLGPRAGRAHARRARGARAAGADAAGRVAPGQPARPPTARSCCSPTRTARRWDRELIAEGQALVRRCLRRDQPGPYQLQAAINAVHSDAPTAAATDWRADPGALRPAAGAAARRRRGAEPRGRGGRGRGPAGRAGRWSTRLDLDGYHLFHAIRADLLRRAGRDAEAAEAYAAAIDRAENAAERDFLRRRRDGLG